MKTSQIGINMIKRFEGCRLTAYRCPAGVPTIGYGHTAGVRMGQRITQAQAERFLKEDLAKFERMVQKYDSTYHWNQNQFDAMVSFAFNIGSITQLTADGSRSITTISQKMLEYNKSAGRVLPGLTERRRAEQALFLKPAVQGPGKPIQAASVNSGHVQINYKPGSAYTVKAEGLRIRTKKAAQLPKALPDGVIIGKIANGARVINQATARVGGAIWMYIGLDKNGREQWICADTGDKVYVN